MLARFPRCASVKRDSLPASLSRSADAGIVSTSSFGSEQLWIAQCGGFLLIIEQPAIGVVGHVFNGDNL
jgi:hypothetical protein